MKSIVPSPLVLAIVVLATALGIYFCNQPQAAPCLEVLLAAQSKIFGPANVASVALISHLSKLYDQSGQYGKANELAEQALNIERAASGATSKASLQAVLARGRRAIQRPEIFGSEKILKVLDEQAELLLLLKDQSRAAELTTLVSCTQELAAKLPELAGQDPQMLSPSIVGLGETVKAFYGANQHQAAVHALSDLISLKSQLSAADTGTYLQTLAELSGYAADNNDSLGAGRCASTIADIIYMPAEEHAQYFKCLATVYCNPSTSLAARLALFDLITNSADRSLLHPPAFQETLYTVPVFLIEQKDFRRAEIAVRRLEEMFPLDWYLHKSLGSAAVRAGDQSMARRYLEKAEQDLQSLRHMPVGALTDERLLEFRVELSELMLDLKEYDRARPIIESATNTFRNKRKKRAVAAYMRGRLHLEQGQWSDARRWFDEALGIKTKAPFQYRVQALAGLAQALDKLDLPQQAQEARIAAQRAAAQKSKIDQYKSKIPDGASGTVRTLPEGAKGGAKRFSAIACSYLGPQLLSSC